MVEVQEILIFLFIVISGIVLANIGYLVLRRILDGRVSQAFSKTISRILQYGFIIGVLWIGLKYVLELNLSSFTASLGILTLAITFSSQNLIQNATAGVLLGARRVIRIEDWIETGNLGLAQVKDITFTHTQVRTITGKLIYLSNTSLLSTSLTNYTTSGFTALEVRVPISGESNFEKVASLCREVAHENKQILPNVSREETRNANKIFKIPSVKEMIGPKRKRTFEPNVFYTDFSFGRVTVTTRFWISDISKRDQITSEFYEELFKKMKEKKIKIA